MNMRGSAALGRTKSLSLGCLLTTERLRFYSDAGFLGTWRCSPWDYPPAKWQCRPRLRWRGVIFKRPCKKGVSAFSRSFELRALTRCCGVKPEREEKVWHARAI